MYKEHEPGMSARFGRFNAFEGTATDAEVSS
jgi:hypothetical protein